MSVICNHAELSNIYASHFLHLLFEEMEFYEISEWNKRTLEYICLFF